MKWKGIIRESLEHSEERRCWLDRVEVQEGGHERSQATEGAGKEHADSTSFWPIKTAMDFCPTEQQGRRV